MGRDADRIQFFGDQRGKHVLLFRRGDNAFRNFPVHAGRAIDEIHTPDSSRYWVKKTYQERFKKGIEPESYDKEPLRIWFKEHGYRGKGKIPKMPDEFIAKMSALYMGIYEKITHQKFVPDLTKNVNARIKHNLLKYIYAK